MLPSSDRARPHLIKTKFSAPQLRAGLVFRPRLMRLLADGLTRPLTLICAPAGYGKTTLLAELARLRARDLLIGICAEDLRFTLDETT